MGRPGDAPPRPDRRPPGWELWLPPGTTAMLSWLLIGLGLATLLSKALLLPFPVSTVGELARWLLRLAVVVSADWAFAGALVLGCLASAALLGTTPLGNRAQQRLVRLLAVGVLLGCGSYSVASVGLMRFTLVPLTWQLLSFAGGPWLMASSLVPLLTPGAVSALGLVLAASCGLAWWPTSGEHPERFRQARHLILVPIALLVAAVVCRQYVVRNWTDPNRWERRIAASPQMVFVHSLLAGWLRGDSYGLDFHPTAIDTSDLETWGQRHRRAPRNGVDSPRGAVKLAAGYLAAAGPAPMVERAVLHAPLDAQRPGAFTSPIAISPRPRNLVVVVLESVGAQYLGLYGSPHDTTPQLERLVAEGGLVAENCYSQAPSSPKCLVALAGSVYPRPDWKLITRDSPDFSVPLLPQVLGRQGYRSAYVHSGYWSWKNRDRFLRERGVDRLIDADSLPAAKPFSWGVADSDALDATLAWIDEAPQQPFHVLFWTIETHHPYLVTGKPRSFEVDDPELARYLNALCQADRLIGRLVDELQRRGLRDSTLIAVTGDHGEAFGQHDQRAHSFGVYEENVRVPLVWLHPALKPQRRLEGNCQQIDLAPTSLGMLGVTPPDCWQGRDLAAEGPAPRAYFFALGNEVLLGLRDGRYKYQYHVGSGRESLFDLAADPGELVDCLARQPERAEAYRRRVSGLVESQRRFLAEYGSR